MEYGCNIVSKNDDIMSIKIGQFKRKLKSCLLEIQNRYDSAEWNQKNFEMETAIRTKIDPFY